MEEYMGHPHYFNPHCAQYDPERAWYFFVMHPEELPEWRRRYQPAEYSNYCDECMILRQHCTNRGGISGRYEHVGCTHCENSWSSLIHPVSLKCRYKDETIRLTSTVAQGNFSNAPRSVITSADKFSFRLGVKLTN